MGAGPWVVVQHVAHEGPGGVAGALGRAGHRWSVVRPDLGQPLPGADAVASLGGLVVLGGPMGVHDSPSHPWLPSERGLLVRAVDAGVVVLGVCLGAQQLALALGAEVRTGGGQEVGAGQVELTADGLADPVLGPAGSPLPCVHWHGDTFSLPAGSRHLATGERYGHQAFAVGRRAYGLQFHVEVDAALADAWAPELPPGVVLDPAAVARIEAVGAPLLDRLVALAG